MLKGASAAGRAAIHAVRVAIIPAPANVADSREILRVLQSFGEVTTYRWLKHDSLSAAPNSAMAVYKDEEAMTALLRACPLTFEVMHSEERHEDAEHADNEAELVEQERIELPGSTATQEVPPSLADAEPNTTADPPTGTFNPVAASSPKAHKATLFRVKANVWQGKHRDWLERHPFWGSFKTEKRGSVQQDLSQRVPLVGLSDINIKGKPEVPIRVLLKRKEQYANKPTLREMMEELRAEHAQSGYSENNANTVHLGFRT